jgi:predicted DCC family thiol-disulfide oxidoreductase YuxK
MEAPIEAMWVLYDETCGFCCSCARWLRAQDKLVPLTCLPRSGDVARRYFGGLPWGRDELVVVDSRGGVYRGSEAFVMALWALQGFRPWARQASKEPLRSRARSLFHWFSSRRHDLSRTLGFHPEVQVLELLDRVGAEPAAQACEQGRCDVPGAVDS